MLALPMARACRAALALISNPGWPVRAPEAPQDSRRSYHGKQDRAGQRAADRDRGGFAGSGYGPGNGFTSNGYDNGPGYEETANEDVFPYYSSDNPYSQGGFPYVQESGDALVQSGRSAAILGNSCVTPVKVCRLYQASYQGLGCSCRVESGRAHGIVSP